MQGFSLARLLTDLSADAFMTQSDMPGGMYDRIHEALLRRGAIPKDRTVQYALVAAMLLSSRIVQQALGPLGNVGSLVQEITEDGVREQAKRILAGVQSAHTQLGAPPIGFEALWAISPEQRSALLQQFSRLDDAGKKMMRAQLMRRTALELAILAEMPAHQHNALLELLHDSPHPTPQQPTMGLAERIAVGMCPWLAHR